MDDRKGEGKNWYSSHFCMKYRYEIPQGLTDEIKWFKFFTLRSLIIGLVTAGIGIPLVSLLKKMNLTVYAIVFWACVTILVTLLTLVKIPNTNWLNGGGEYIDQFLIKRLIRRRKRCLYIKGYDQVKYEEAIRAYDMELKGEENNDLFVG